MTPGAWPGTRPESLGWDHGAGRRGGGGGGDTLGVTRPGDRQSECRTGRSKEGSGRERRQTDCPRQQAETRGEERRVGAIAPGEEPQSAPVVQERQTGARQPAPHPMPSARLSAVNPPWWAQESEAPGTRARKELSPPFTVIVPVVCGTPTTSPSKRLELWLGGGGAAGRDSNSTPLVSSPCSGRQRTQ